jgi:hypothetical protein
MRVLMFGMPQQFITIDFVCVFMNQIERRKKVAGGESRESDEIHSKPQMRYDYDFEHVGAVTFVDLAALDLCNSTTTSHADKTASHALRPSLQRTRYGS